MNSPRDIIIRPVVSEKSYAGLERNTYTFLVALDRPDRVVIPILTRDRQPWRIRQRWLDDGADRRLRVGVEGKHRAQVGDHSAGERQPVRLGARMGLFVG